MQGILAYSLSWIVQSQRTISNSCSVAGNVLLQREFRTHSGRKDPLVNGVTVLPPQNAQGSQNEVSILLNVSALQKPDKKKHKKSLDHEIADYVVHRDHHNIADDHICSFSTFHQVVLPKNQKCAPECPYSQQLPGNKCHKVCVSESLCALFNPGHTFADVESKQCIPACGRKKTDKIPGCAQCAGVGVCVRCVTGFTIVDNGARCRSVMEKVWPTIWMVLGSLAVVLIIYAVNLSRRFEINTEVAERSLQFREHCKLWNLGHDKVWHKYSLIKTNLSTLDLAGQGIILYYRRITFSIGAALLLFATSYITYQLSSLKFLKDQANAFSDCRILAAAEKHGHVKPPQQGAHQEAFLTYSVCMFLSMAFSYVVLMIASIIFEVSMIKYSRCFDDEHATHEDYALQGSNVPKDCTDPNEIHEWAQKILDDMGEGHRVVGASIAYDFKEHEEVIQNAIREWVEELECKFDHKQKEEPTPTTDKRKIEKHRSGLSIRQQSGAEVQEQKSRDCFSAGSIARLEFLDVLFWGSCSDEEQEPPAPEQIIEVLKSLQGSGHCYLVFETAAAAVAFDRIAKLRMFRGKHQIKLKGVNSEPPGLYWQNFSSMNFWPRIILGIFIIIMTIILWVAMYMPYALFTGSRTSFWEGTLLGLIISGGNALMAQIIDMVTQWAGFRQKDRRDIAILSLALLSTLLNTVFDLWMVLRISKGVGGAETDAAEASSHGIDAIVARELFAMIVPGYLILPYLVTPFFEHVMPYFLGLWLVRSRRTSLRDAEDCLKCPEFDICWRYSDMHNNFTVCTLMLFTVSPHSYEVMLWLVVFLVLVHGIDKYKLLRQTSQTFYTTKRLSDAASQWWCVPTGTLAAVTSWWACRAEILQSENAALTSIMVFFVHCALWLFVYGLCHHFSKRPEVVETLPYKKMCENLHAEGMMWSYFSTNPIYCLRSKYLGLKEPGSDYFPCVPYVPGRQHLQPGAPSHYQTNSKST